MRTESSVRFEFPPVSSGRGTCRLPHVVLAAMALAAGSSEVCGAARDDWMKFFRLGAGTAFNFKGDFSLNGAFALPGAGAAAGPDLIYDDGYVRTDATGNAGGLTSFWGYQDPTQVVGGDILFHRGTGMDLTSPVSREKNDIDVGIDLAYGGVLKMWKRTLIGWQFGYNYLPIGIKDTRSLAVNLSRQAFSHVAPPVIPGAPYNGGSDGLGPLIGTTPTGPLAAADVAATLQGTREIDTTLHAFKLGPMLHWDLARRWGLEASAGGVMGMFDGEYRFNELAVAPLGSTTPVSGAFGSTEISYGGYASATLLWRTSERADLYVTAEYQHLGGVTYGAGGREARLRTAGGVMISVGVNWPF